MYKIAFIYYIIQNDLYKLYRHIDDLKKSICWKAKVVAHPLGFLVQRVQSYSAQPTCQTLKGLQ
jgi:hypothetical protein